MILAVSALSSALLADVAASSAFVLAVVALLTALLALVDAALALFAASVALVDAVLALVAVVLTCVLIHGMTLLFICSVNVTSEIMLPLTVAS